MIGIQIITHGKFAEGLLDSVDMITGETDNILINELKRSQDIDEFRGEVLETTKKLLADNPNGVLIFTDIFGASPYNVSQINSRDVETENYKVISGVNLPILIEAIFSRKQMEIDELYNNLIEQSKTSFVGWEK